MTSISLPSTAAKTGTNKLLIESEIEIAFKNALTTHRLELVGKSYLCTSSLKETFPSQIGNHALTEGDSEDYYYMTVICDNLLLYYAPSSSSSSYSSAAASGKSLLEINLSYNALSLTSLQLFLQTLTELQIQTLISLQLEHCQLTKDHCILLKYFLLSVRSLKRLSLGSNQISNFGLQILSEIFVFDQDHHKSFNASGSTSSNLFNKGQNAGSGSRLGGTATESKSQSHSPLSLTPSIVQQLFPSLPLSSENSIFSLQEIDFTNNAIQDSGILSFCRSCLYFNKKLLSLKTYSSSLKRLIFDNNQITDKGIYCLAQLLNSKLLIADQSNKSTTKSQLLPVNVFGINLEEISFHQNPQITSHGIICLLGNNHMTTNPINSSANSPANQQAHIQNHLVLYTNVSTCCIHSTLKQIDFGQCHLSLLIFQYLIPMISKGAFQMLESINLEFSTENALEVVEISASHYNKIYGNHLSTVKSVSSLSANSINSTPTMHSLANTNIVMSYCFQLFVDALLGIHHKNRVSIKKILLGQLPKVIFEKCVLAKKQLQQLQSPNKGEKGNGQTIQQNQNIYEDCRRSLEFMNPASEFFQLPYISNIELWLQSEQYNNLLYMAKPLFSLNSAPTIGKRKESTESPQRSRPQGKEKLPPESRQVPPRHPEIVIEEKDKFLPKASNSPFRGKAKNVSSNGGSEQNRTPFKEFKAVEKQQPLRYQSPKSSPEPMERKKTSARPTSPQKISLSPRKSPERARSSSPTKRTSNVSDKTTVLESEEEFAEEDKAIWPLASKMAQQRQQRIPSINEQEISDLPPLYLKKLQNDQTSAVHTLSTELQKLLQVSTPATIHVLSSVQQREGGRDDLTVTASVLSNALTSNTNNREADNNSNVITILDPYEIERASISSQLSHQQSLFHAANAADVDHSFYSQQSLISHEVQYELYNLTTSLSEITHFKIENVKDKEKNVTASESEKLLNSKERSLSPSRPLRPSSPSRDKKDGLNRTITTQIEQYFENRYQQEIEAIHASIINIANHYSKLDHRFQQFYEKKMMTHLTQLENRLHVLEERQSAVISTLLDGGAIDPQDRLNQRFIQNLATATLSGPALFAFNRYQQEQGEQRLLLEGNSEPPSSHPRVIASSDMANDDSNSMVQQLQYRIDLLERKLEILSTPNSEQQKHDHVSKTQQLSNGYDTTPNRNNSAINANDSSANLDYKQQLLRQLSYLDDEITRERHELEVRQGINHQNILLLHASKSAETSPLSASNTVRTHPISHGNYVQQNSNPADTGLIIDSDLQPAFVPSTVSNMHRFERIAALHATFRDQNLQRTPRFHNDTISQSQEIFHTQNNLSSSARQLTRNSSNSPHRKTPSNAIPLASTESNQNAEFFNQPIEAVMPEYRFDTLLPNNFYPSAQTHQDTQENHRHLKTARQPVESTRSKLSTPPPPSKRHQHHALKSYMLSTRSSDHKRTHL